jgi:hypothetical protein
VAALNWNGGAGILVSGVFTNREQGLQHLHDILTYAISKKKAF